jgi:hypothetical protein
MLKVNPGPFCSLLLGEMADTAGVRFRGGGGGGEGAEELPHPVVRHKVEIAVTNRNCFKTPP